MKVFFAGYHNPNFIGLAEYIEKAIRSQGHELEVFDYRSWIIPGRIRDRFVFLNSLDMRRINEDLFRRVRRFKPDIFIVNGGWTIYPETVEKIKKIGKIRTVNWIADFPLKFTEYLKAGPHYDHFFTSGTDALARYREAGHNNGKWLPFACDPDIHRPLSLSGGENAKYGCDICFVGSNYPERVEVLEKLADHDLGIWGIGWDKLEKGSPLRKSVKGGMLRPGEWVKAFNASKIVLNILPKRASVDEPFALSLADKDFHMCNMRTFEILGCGAFQLTDKKKDAEMLFNNKEHLVFYGDADELRRSVDYYLARPEERKKIAGNGKREALEKHTYKCRVKKMFSIVEGRE